LDGSDSLEQYEEQRANAIVDLARAATARS